MYKTNRSLLHLLRLADSFRPNASFTRRSALALRINKQAGCLCGMRNVRTLTRSLAHDRQRLVFLRLSRGPIARFLSSIRGADWVSVIIEFFETYKWMQPISRLSEYLIM